MFNFKGFKYALVVLNFLLGSICFGAGSLSNDAKANVADNVLSLEDAVSLAQANDPWLVGNQHYQDAMESMSVAAGTLPDPKFSIGLMNIASDTFDFSQEGMTQFKASVSQQFSRGKSLSIKQRQLELMGSQYPYQREDRRGKVAVTTAKLWLDVYKAQKSIALIENDRTLFEQLVDVAEASYSSAVGKTRQQDIVRAQLELTRLDDRLTMLKQKEEVSQQQLGEWLSEYLGGEYPRHSVSTIIAKAMPDIGMSQKALFSSVTEVDPQLLFEHFSHHPAVNALDQKIKATRSGIDLAKQSYKPVWGLNASYGYRDDMPNGDMRSDLFSLGVSFDLPIFTKNRQDKQLQSAISNSAAVETEKWLLLRKLIAAFESNRTQLINLNARMKLFQSRLLPQMRDQAEASLTAYTNDDGDFSEVVRSRIAELNATIDALNIKVDRQKIVVQLNYFFMNTADDLLLTRHSSINSTIYSSALSNVGENK